MKAYEIPGWLDGKKIRRKGWENKGYWYCNSEEDAFITNGGMQIKLSPSSQLFQDDDWEPYEEPEPKTVTLYRYTYEDKHIGEIVQHEWINKTWLALTWAQIVPERYKLLKTESKEVDFDA